MTNLVLHGDHVSALALGKATEEFAGGVAPQAKGFVFKAPSLQKCKPFAGSTDEEFTAYLKAELEIIRQAAQRSRIVNMSRSFMADRDGCASAKVPKFFLAELRSILEKNDAILVITASNKGYTAISKETSLRYLNSMSKDTELMKHVIIVGNLGLPDSTKPQYQYGEPLTALAGRAVNDYLLVYGTKIKSANFFTQDGTPRYSIETGASMAAPILSGIIALYLQHKQRMGETPSAQDVVASIKKSVIPQNEKERFGLGIFDVRILFSDFLTDINTAFNLAIDDIIERHETLKPAVPKREAGERTIAYKKRVAQLPNGTALLEELNEYQKKHDYLNSLDGRRLIGTTISEHRHKPMTIAAAADTKDNAIAQILEEILSKS